jgi:cephalosporin hydroxylase
VSEEHRPTPLAPARKASCSDSARFEEMWERGVEERLDWDLGSYYVRRVSLHMNDSYAGVRMRKFPEDLRVYEHLLWDEAVEVVVEIGLGHGGSALWFRDRLLAHGRYGRVSRPLVVSLDTDIAEARQNLARVDPSYAETIRLVEGDVRDPCAAEQVRRQVSEGARVMVVEDSAHRYDTTLAALAHFSPLVPVSGYIVVEDGHRDLPGMLPNDVPSKSHGVLAAMSEWLRSEAGEGFVMRRDQERYLMTSNPRGWLQRLR